MFNIFLVHIDLILIGILEICFKLNVGKLGYFYFHNRIKTKTNSNI